VRVPPARFALRLAAALIALAALVLGAALALVEPEPTALAAAQAAAEGEYAELPDGRARYRYAAAPGRPLVVLVHGGALNSLSIWDPLLAALDTSRVGVLRFDSYGQGYSARPDVRHDATLYVREIDGLLELAGAAAPVHLVGYSMGGLIATEYAAHRPERVASLTLIAPAGLGTQLRWPVRVGTWPVVGEAIYRLRGHEILVEGYELMTQAERYVAHVKSVETRWLPIEGTGRSLLSQLRSLPIATRAGAYAFVAASDVPVLAVFGEHDQTVPASSAAALRDVVPAARIEVLDGASHALVYDDAARIAPLLATFVAERAPPL